MAANEYYNTATPDNKASSNSTHTPLSVHPVPSSRYSAYNSSTPGHADSPTSPPYDDISPTYHQSQQSLTSDPRYYGAGGGGTANEPGTYADDIPLQPRRQRYSADNETAKPHQEYENGAGQTGVKSEPRRKKKRSGIFGGKIPWVVYTLTLIQTTVFIVELARNAILTKTPIAIRPQFNPMIGPSFYVLVNMGARYVPCMKAIDNIPPETKWPCPNTTSSDVAISNQCTLTQLCGFSAPDVLQPSQWYRFIVPIFLHAGIIHIAFNMLLQLTIGREMEKEIGSLRFFLVYVSSGIFGFVLGGNFAPNGIASTGASGALFGVIALMLLDLLYTWGKRKSPGKDLAWIIVDIVISFVLGLLPGLDNFSHIGGFLMGLVLGICILHSPDALRQRVGADDPPYTAVNAAHKPLNIFGGMKGFAKQPVGFFKGRKPLWWAWWIVRAAALVGVLVCFIVLLNNFYKYHNTCTWCKYLSCLPVSNWCNIGNLKVENITTPSKREILGATPFFDLQRFL